MNRLSIYLLVLIFATNLLGSVPIPTEKGISVIKSGDSLFIRTSFDQTRDLLQCLDVFGTGVIGDNRSVNFKSSYLIPADNPQSIPELFSNSIYFHNTADDSAPYYFNGNRCGGNMGYGDMRVVNSISHGKTVEDAGSEWVDDLDVKWYLLRVVDQNTMWFLSENIGVGDFWDFKTVITGNLRHSRNALHQGTIAISSYSSGYLKPSVSGQTKKAFLNGLTEIISEGIYYCDSLRIEENFYIPDLSCSLDSVRSRVGSTVQPPLNLGDPHLSVEINYNYDAWGGCQILSEITAVKAISAPFWGNIQANSLSKGSYDSTFVYMPNVLPLSDGIKYWDLRELNSFDTGPAVSLNYYKSGWEKQDVPPYRMIQYLGNGINDLDIGFSHGYSLTFGDTRSEVRRDRISLSWTLANIKKSFPYSIFTSVSQPAGFKQTVSAYRCYFNPKRHSDNVTSVYWFKENGDYILNCDYHKTADRDTVMLPDEMNDKYVHVLEKSSAIDVLTDRIIGNRLILSSNEDYSYGVFRINDIAPPDAVSVDSVHVHLPDVIYTTSKSKYSIYYQNLIRREYEKKESIVVNCSTGFSDSMKYNLDYLLPGEYDFSLSVFDSTGLFIEKDSTKIIVTDGSLAFNDTLRILFVGDSFTLAGVYEKYLKDLYTSTTGRPIKLLGTNANFTYPFWGPDNGIFHEGYSGRSWDWFANYVESPFVFDSFGAMDCARYFNETLKGEKPDLVVFFLGICNMGLTDPSTIEIIDNHIDTFFTTSRMQKVVNSFKAVLPGSKFGVVLIPPPNEREYTFTDPDYWERKIMNHRLGERYENFFRNYDENISVIPVSPNIDMYLGFGETDFIHPNGPGYLQIAHSIYGWIKYQISKWVYSPTDIFISYNSEGALIEWNGSTGSSVYNIYRSSDPFIGFEKLATTALTSYTDQNASISDKYFYYVTSEKVSK